MAQKSELRRRSRRAGGATLGNSLLAQRRDTGVRLIIPVRVLTWEDMGTLGFSILDFQLIIWGNFRMFLSLSGDVICLRPVDEECTRGHASASAPPLAHCMYTADSPFCLLLPFFFLSPFYRAKNLIYVTRLKMDAWLGWQAFALSVTDPILQSLWRIVLR